MKKTIHLTLFLAIVAALATALLSAVNEITGPIIKENQTREQFAAYEALYPGETSFETVEFTPDPDNLVKEVIKVGDKAYVLRVENQGFSDVINFLIGFNMDGSQSVYKVLSVNDTPNIGTKVAGDDFVQKMTGKTTSDSFDTISGATVSSTAVVKGVSAAVTVFNSLTGLSGGPATSAPSAKAGKLELASMTGAKLISEEDLGDTILYHLSAKGFDSNEDNEYRIVVNKDKATIESIDMFVFVDTEGIGDQVNESFLKSFVGFNLAQAPETIDGVTGATKTSESLAKVLSYLIHLYQRSASFISFDNLEAGQIVKDEPAGNAIKVTIKAKGFDGENVFEIVQGENYKVTSVKMVDFKDTVGIGDKVDQAYLDQLVGLSLVEPGPGIDGVSGATKTSESVAKALKALINHVKGEK